jgi:hypothetical protein
MNTVSTQPISTPDYLLLKSKHNASLTFHDPTDYNAYYFPDRDVKSAKVGAAADAGIEQLKSQPQLQDTNGDSADATVLSESSRAGNPAAAEPGGNQPRHLDVLKPGRYNIPGFEGDGTVRGSV